VNVPGSGGLAASPRFASLSLEFVKHKKSSWASMWRSIIPGQRSRRESGATKLVELLVESVSRRGWKRLAGARPAGARGGFRRNVLLRNGRVVRLHFIFNRKKKLACPSGKRAAARFAQSTGRQSEERRDFRPALKA